MEISQEVALQSPSYKPITLFRYVDDTFIIWPQSKHNLHIFLEHYYNQHNDIKLKMDIYSNNSFPFLDLLVSRLPNGLGHSACRKLTDRYHHAQSQHHTARKFSVADTQVNRFVSLFKSKNLKLYRAMKRKVFNTMVTK